MSNNPKTFIETYFWPGIIAVVVLGGLANLIVWFWPRNEMAVAQLPSYSAQQVVQGRDLCQANCSACHGAEGNGYAQAGTAAPALNGDEHAWHHPDSQIAGFIRHGVGQMPAVGPDWTNEDIDATLSYIKPWWEPEQLAYQTESSEQNP